MMIEENGETPNPVGRRKNVPFRKCEATWRFLSGKSEGCCNGSRQDFRIQGEDNVELERCPPANGQLVESTVIVCLAIENFCALVEGIISPLKWDISMNEQSMR